MSDTAHPLIEPALQSAQVAMACVWVGSHRRSMALSVQRVLGRSALLTALLVAAGCASVLPRARAAPQRPAQTSVTVVSLHGSPLELHLSMPAPATLRGSLVLYASGDGGWFGAAVDMFRTIAAQGYPTVGFSSRTFMKLERPPHAALNESQLVADYVTILAQASRAMGLPSDGPVILTGWSRGASFATLAGSAPVLRDRVRGIIAIGLSAEEDFALDGDGDGSDDGPLSNSVARGTALFPYARLQQASGLRSAVIQASGDNYLPATRARELAGPETPERRFYAIPARNHRFSGGRAAFVGALVGALSWVDGPPATLRSTP